MADGVPGAGYPVEEAEASLAEQAAARALRIERGPTWDPGSPEWMEEEAARAVAAGDGADNWFIIGSAHRALDDLGFELGERLRAATRPTRKGTSYGEPLPGATLDDEGLDELLQGAAKRLRVLLLEPPP